MATLEVHDGQGRVEYVTIRREHLAMFGADPKCDVVLADPEALPFHGRIRFKKGVFKIEAFPEAKSILLNGNKVVASKFLVGDEIRVGAYRIFLINADDISTETEKTRVQAPPVPYAHSGPIPLHQTTGIPLAPSIPIQAIEPGQLFEPSIPNPVVNAAPAPLLRRRNWSQPAQAPAADDEAEARLKRAAPAPAPKEKEKEKAPPRHGSPWKRIIARLGGNQAPGEERIAGSPLVLGLVLALALLGVTGWALWAVIVSSTADRQYRMTIESYEEGDYRNTIAIADLFLQSNPKDSRAGKIRVIRGLANVRQYSGGAGAVWTSALEAAKEMHEDVGKLREYGDERVELAEIVLRGAESLADRAKERADAAMLDQAKLALALHRRIAGEAAKSLEGKSGIAKKLADAEASVVKGQTRTRVLAAMEAAIKKGSAAEVYAARDGLVAAYPDLATDRVLIERLKGANELLRQAVRLDPTTQPAETSPSPDPLGPPTTLVLRAKITDRKPTPTSGGASPIVFAIADDLAYGIDGSDGSPLWQVPIGLASPFPPVPVTGAEPGALVFDVRHDSLLRLDARTGALKWRLDIDERVAAAPLILGNEVFLVAPSGRLLKIDLASGTLLGSLLLNRPLLRAPVADEAGQFLYLAADSAVVFVLARDPMSCVAVEYLGHDPGTIGCAPARVGRYLIVCENQGIKDGRWTVYLMAEEGGKVRAVQTLPIPGWTWETPASFASVVWSVSDRLGLTAYAVGEVGAKVALQPIAKTIPDSAPSGPAFARARSEREMFVSAGRTGRYALNVEGQSIIPSWALTAAGPALAPIQAADKLLVFTQQSTDVPGVSLWGLNPADGSVAWRTVLGSPWPSGISPSADGGSLSALGSDGRIIPLSRGQLAAGGFIEGPIPAGESADRPAAGALSRIESGDLAVLVPAAASDHVFVSEAGGPLHRVDLPSALGATPLLWGSDLLAPGIDGRVYLIDPKTGGATAEPYVPPYDRSKPTRWLSPVKVEGDAVILVDTSGRVRRLEKATEPRPRLAVSKEVDLGNGVAVDPAGSGGAVVLVTDDGRIRSLAARDLGPLGAWPLESPRAVGPVSAAGHAFVIDASSRVLGFGGEGRRLWSIDLKESPPTGPPVLRDGNALFLGRDGTLLLRSLADGTALDRLPLGVLPAGGPWAVGEDLAVSSGPGSVRLIRDEAE